MCEVRLSEGLGITQPKRMDVGQKVTWVRPLRGGYVTKTGFVEAVVPAGAELTPEQRRAADAYGRPRQRQSYLVRVPTKTGKGKGKLYWPPEDLLVKTL